MIRIRLRASEIPTGWDVYLDTNDRETGRSLLRPKDGNVTIGGTTVKLHEGLAVIQDFGGENQEIISENMWLNVHVNDWAQLLRFMASDEKLQEIIDANASRI